jgi:uncharacterized membrane protein YcaP (DUF421 family)
MLLRKQGLHDLNEIDIAILESDGTFTVTRLNDRLDVKDDDDSSQSKF